MDALYFRDRAEWEAWLEDHHASATEVLVGFHKKRSGMPSMTWPEAVDVALCFGWIDGVRRGVDEQRYVNRFTPRRPGSNWSAINIAKVEALIEQGRMRPAGLAAFEARRADRSAVYSYEQRQAAALDPEMELDLRANERAWADFQARPPSYRKAVTHWIMSAVNESTRRRRLAQLIESSAAGRTVPPLTPRRRAP